MEKRTSLTPTAQFRAGENDSGQKVLEGYFIRFNEETNLFDNYFESVSPDAISDDIADQDIRALFDHDTSKVLGRTKSKTLTIRKDKEGLFGSVVINNDDQEALSIYAKVARGDVSSASFGFYINGDTLTEKKRGDGMTEFHDLLIDVELFEISIVAFPAYPTTEIGARSKDIEKFRAEKLSQRKSKLIEELENKWKIQLS